MSRDLNVWVTVLQMHFEACRGAGLTDVDWSHSAMMAKEPSSENIYVQQLSPLGLGVGGQKPGAGGSASMDISSGCKGLHHPLLHLRRRRKPVHVVYQWATLPQTVTQTVKI